MEILDLYNLAKQENIEVIQYPMQDNGSISFMAESGNCYIGMDESTQNNSAQERVHLSHEIGHCLTGSFYNRYAAVDSRDRHENCADKWAIKKLIPEADLDAAVAEGYTEIWELAERFGVTEEFARKAVCLYTNGNLAADLYF